MWPIPPMRIITASRYFNAPLGPIAALRISGRYEHQAGFIDQYGIMARQGNLFTGVPVLANPGDVAGSPAVYYSKKDVNYDDISSDRASFLLQPSDALRVQLDWNGSYSRVSAARRTIQASPAGLRPGTRASHFLRRAMIRFPSRRWRRTSVILIC